MSKHISLSGLKTLLEPLIHLINKKAESPNWNENDINSPSYIEGRTHYEIPTKFNIIDEKVTIDSNGEWYQTCKDFLNLGSTYLVNFDGKIYSCVAKSDFSDGIYIGNAEFPLYLWDQEIGQAEDSREPFYIVTYKDWSEAYLLSVEGAHTITIEGTLIEKINEKYLPGVLGKQGEGIESVTFGDNYVGGAYSFSEGAYNYIYYDAFLSHSEGQSNSIYASSSHAEGYENLISSQAYFSHVEGSNNTVEGPLSHAEGYYTIAKGAQSHSEGSSHYYGYWANIGRTQTPNIWEFTTYSQSPQPYIGAIIQAPSSEDYEIKVYAKITDCSLIKQINGRNTYLIKAVFNSDIAATDSASTIAYIISGIALGENSHTEGYCTVAEGDNQHVQGRHNISDTTSVHIVGNGSNSTRSNAHTLDWDGNAWYSGDVYVGSTSGTNKDEGSKKLATESYVDEKLALVISNNQIDALFEDGFFPPLPNASGVSF